MNLLAGQLSLLELEAVQPSARPTPARQALTRGDTPAQDLTARDERQRPRGRERAQRASEGVVLLTTDEAAAVLRVHPRTVQRLVERGQLSAVHLGSAVRFDPRDVEALIRDVKERRCGASAEVVRARPGATSSFADRLRSQ